MFLAALCVMVCSSALAISGPALGDSVGRGSVFIGLLVWHLMQSVGICVEIIIDAGDCEMIMRS
jgi:hypothetical protein